MSYVALNHKLDRKVKNDAGTSEKLKAIAELDLGLVETQDIAGVLGTTALTAETQTITENITDPDIPRNLKVKANAATVVGNIVVNGTDIDDNAISETFVLNGDVEVQGNKAFKTVISIELPVETNAGTDEVQVGVANKLGLPYKLERNTVLKAYRDNVLEATAPTVAVDSANIENNTVLLDSAMNGTDVNVYLIV
jgi:5'(3')-deoxyribonucleotidase